MRKRVADIAIEILLELGVDDCFAVVGGGAMYLDNALALNGSMKKHFNHHEQACSMAADSYARISGRPAAVCVTSGPGATNAITGVMGAWQDSLPMIVLSGQVRYAISVSASGLPLRYRGIQEFEIIPSVSNMTKYAEMIVDPLAIRRSIIRAYRCAMEGRRGPSWLDIPLDVQSAVVEEDDLYPADELPVPSMPSQEVFLDLVRSIKQAQRPCFLLGSGVISGGAYDMLPGFMDSCGVPCVGEAWVADICANDQPCFFGLSGNIGPRTGNFILQNADLIIAVGDSLGFRQTGFAQDTFAPQAKLIMVDADANEAEKPGLRIDAFLSIDVKDFFQGWMQWGDSIEVPAAWRAYCEALKDRFDVFAPAEGLDPDERVCAYRFWQEFDRYAPDKLNICLGNNTANAVKLQVGKAFSGHRIVTNYTCGSMGYDLPAAIGACLATGENTLCVTGDGSIMMNLQELQTIRHHDLPIKVVVFSNDGYNAIRQTAKNFFDGVCTGCSAETGVSFPSFRDVAAAFGYQYLYCGCNRELPHALDLLFKTEGLVVLEVAQRLDDPLTPKLQSRMNPDGTLTAPALDDMYPFISREEHDELMIGRL